jgi:hypothetical protein
LTSLLESRGGEGGKEREGEGAREKEGERKRERERGREKEGERKGQTRKLVRCAISACLFRGRYGAQIDAFSLLIDP